MDESKNGFWYADGSFPIFVGLLAAGVFAGTHMYYVYGLGHLMRSLSSQCYVPVWKPASMAQ